MAHLEVQPKSRSTWWLWLIIIIIIAAVGGFLATSITMAVAGRQHL